jgi:RNA polymerase primary sigma factor
MSTKNRDVYIPAHNKQKYLDIYTSQEFAECIKCEYQLECEEFKQKLLEKANFSEGEFETLMNAFTPEESIEDIYDTCEENENNTESYNNIEDNAILKDGCSVHRYCDELYIPYENDYEYHADQLLLRETLTDILETLTARESKIICLRFGLFDDKEMTLEEVGNQFSLTRERVRQIEKKALTKLKSPSRARKIECFYDI